MSGALDTPLSVTFFPDVHARTATESVLTLRALAGRVVTPTAPVKTRLPLLKLASFGDKPTAKGALRSDANTLCINGVEGDYDAGSMTPADAADALKRAGIAALIYTTPSHRADRQRWRVLCPTSEWLAPLDRAEFVARLNGALGGVLGGESFTCSQAFFYGREADQPQPATWLVDGRFIDQATELPAVYPSAAKPIAVPLLPTGLDPDAHSLAALEQARQMFQAADVEGKRHPTLVASCCLLAPMVASAHLDADTAHAALHDAMAESGREPNDGEVESTLAWAVSRAVPYEPPTGGKEFDSLPLPAVTKRTLALVHPVDCATGPRRGYLVKHLLAAGDVGAIVGPPSSGKSMLAPYIAYAVAQGRAIFGLRTKPGRTLYVAAEDATGMRQRVHALKMHHGDAPDFALAATENLREPGNVTLLLDTVADWNPALVVIDTLGAAWAGMDENASGDMGAVVSVARRIAGNVRAVLLVHHTAKQGDGTPRGHSALNGTLDMALRLEPRDGGGVIRGYLGKNRNGTTDRDIAFRFVAVDLGADDDGDAITAPMAVELAADDTTVRAPRLSPTERRAFDVLVSLGGDLAEVPESDWRAACIDQAISTSDDPKNRGKVVAKIIKSLLDKAHVAAGNGMVRACVRL